MRLIGLDVGSTTIGLALFDVERQLASPLMTIRRTKFSVDAEILRGQIHKYEVEALVIGLPLALDGADSPRAQAVRAFSRNFATLEPIAVTLWNEQFSTVAVECDLIAMDVSRAKRVQVIDKMAAAYILQGSLDALKSRGEKRAVCEVGRVQSFKFATLRSRERKHSRDGLKFDITKCK